MKDIELRSVFIDNFKTINGQVVFENGKPVKEKVEFTTKQMLDEICWCDAIWSDDEGHNATFVDCADRFADGETGDHLHVEDRHHERIAKKIKGWGPKDDQGRPTAGNANTRKIRSIINAFVFAPLVKEEPKALNGNDKETPALPAPAS